jgi:hypothetical protein
MIARPVAGQSSFGQRAEELIRGREFVTCGIGAGATGRVENSPPRRQFGKPARRDGGFCRKNTVKTGACRVGLGSGAGRVF